MTTDFQPAAFDIIGFSGFIEVTALAIWGVDLIGNIRAGKRGGALSVPQEQEKILD